MTTCNSLATTNDDDVVHRIASVIRQVGPYYAKYGKSLQVTPDALDYLAIESEGIDTGDELEVVPTLRVKPRPTGEYRPLTAEDVANHGY